MVWFKNTVTKGAVDTVGGFWVKDLIRLPVRFCQDTTQAHQICIYQAINLDVGYKAIPTYLPEWSIAWVSYF